MALTPTQQAEILAAFKVGSGPIDIANRLGLSYSDVYWFLNNQQEEPLRRPFDPIPSSASGQSFSPNTGLVSTDGSIAITAEPGGIVDITVAAGGSSNATSIQGIPVAAAPPGHNGELLIYDSVLNEYVPGDPLVQGLFPEGHTATGLNPVLVSGKGLDGNQYDIAVDNTGHLLVGGTTTVIGQADVVNSANSTTSLLSANAVFTGTAVDLTATAVTKISVEAFSDQGSAPNGLQLQFSTDGTSWDYVIRAILLASLPVVVVAGVHARFFRLVYTNGTGNQGIFRLQTLLSSLPAVQTTKSLDTVVATTDAAGITRAVLTGKSFINPSLYTDIATDAFGNLQVGFGGEASDAFNRARTSQPFTAFAAQFQYDTQPLLFNTSLVGTGTVTKTANESSITLSTGGTASGASAINQTKSYFRYCPGKSALIIMTGFLGAQKTNVRSRIGYFDANDGVYFEMDGTLGVSVNQRSSASGSPVTTSILQANWNKDPMNGTGPSGITIDWSKTQIFAMDMQWLGVGRVRWSLFVDDSLVVVHEIVNSNNSTSPYTNTANLPCRAEITNTGIAATTTTMKQICMSIMSEGSVEFPFPYKFTTGNKGTSITAASGTRTPLVSLQPKVTFNSITNRTFIQLETTEVFVTGANPVYWELVYNGTLTGSPSFNSVDANSGVNFDIAATGCTGGIVIASGYAGGGAGSSKSGTGGINIAPEKAFTLNFAGNAAEDTWTLCVTGVGGTAPSLGVLSWSEVR
jgi:hypothetical protein